MGYERTKLVEEDNTIYEIDLDCMRKKQAGVQRDMVKKEKQKAGIKNVKSSKNHLA